MKIGIISDTHGFRPAMRQAVAAMPPVDMWLHAGDYSQDAMFLAKLVGSVPITAVRGNCDGFTATAYDAVLQLAGKTLWLTHGHHYGINSGLQEMLMLAKRDGIDIVVFGHTHVALIERRDGVLFINPGSAARSRIGQNSCAVLELGATEAEASLIFLQT